MKKSTCFWVFLLCLFAGTNSVAAQDDPVIQKIRKAVEMMDNTLIDESIGLLNEVLEESPDHYTARYELGYAYNLKGDYREAIRLLEQLKKHPQADALLYQLLGNCYDDLGETKKAVKTYRAGLKRFPGAGNLYLELGTVSYNKKDYNQAFAYYETGIREDPAFPSNYYRAALMAFNSTEKIWGMLYGELFMNLERGSKRTEEMSRLLYDCYRENIRIQPATGTDTVRSISISFAKENRLTFDGKKPVVSFSQLYEMLTGVAFPPDAAAVDIASLSRMRSWFLDLYFQKKHQESYPNILYEYQQKVKDAGHSEAYSYWVLSQGDDEGFATWYDSHREAWENFIRWYQDNPIRLDKEHFFCRDQYE